MVVAGCLCNDMLREARNRGVAITKLEVSADGGFAGRCEIVKKEGQ